MVFGYNVLHRFERNERACTLRLRVCARVPCGACVTTTMRSVVTSTARYAAGAGTLALVFLPFGGGGRVLLARPPTRIPTAPLRTLAISFYLC
jgi:hypothetical protein